MPLCLGHQKRPLVGAFIWLGFWSHFFLQTTTSFSAAAAATDHSHHRYGQLCTIEPDFVRQVPVVNRASLADQHSTAVLLGNDEPPRGEESSTRQDTTTVSFYRCICPQPDYYDNRTTHTYCPLDSAWCGLPTDPDSPAECISDPLASVAYQRMVWFAWPLVWATLLLIGILLATSQAGLAASQYVRRIISCSRFTATDNGNDHDDDQQQQQQQQELDELLHLYRNPLPNDEVPKWYQVWAVRRHRYQQIVLVRWRIAMQQYQQQTEKARVPMRLYLKTKVYRSDTTTFFTAGASKTARILEGSRSCSSSDAEEGNCEQCGGWTQAQPQPQPQLPSSYVASIEEEEGLVQIPAVVDSTCRFCDDDNYDHHNHSGAGGVVDDDDGSGGGDEEEGGEEKDCAICFAQLQGGERIGNLECGHEFHLECLKSWIEMGRRNTCPLCQAPNLARPRHPSIHLSL